MTSAVPPPPATGAGARRDVGSNLGFNFLQPSTLALQLAAPLTGLLEEQLTVVDGRGLPLPVTEAVGARGTRVHIVEAGVGPVSVSYTAATAPVATTPTPDRYDDEVLVALRQSRYCQSDLLMAVALAELGPIDDPAEIATAAAAWVFEQMAYIPGSTGPEDTATDVLLSRRGICRDFAHLTIALCRARSVPARLVAVYAPGLTPMDFHAVAEVWVGDRWLLHDSTRLAPRSSLVRIATGRDAADTALASTLRGDIEMVTQEVWAVVEGDLPPDDHVSPFELP